MKELYQQAQVSELQNEMHRRQQINSQRANQGLQQPALFPKPEVQMKDQSTEPTEVIQPQPRQGYHQPPQMQTQLPQELRSQYS